MGRFDPFPPLSLSDRCGSGEETFARTHRNGQDAPIADLPAPASERDRSTQT